MPQRIQSPSSINCYKMCPQCYYYRYVMNLQLPSSIYMTRGKIVHAALEDFFKISPSLIVGALIFSFGVGSFSGLFPARKAAKMKPVDALRYE